MQVKTLLQMNGYDVDIGEGILEMEMGSLDQIRDIPLDCSKLFEGVEIFSDDDNSMMVIINFEYKMNEFSPIFVLEFDDKNNLIVETMYDENLNRVCVNDLT